MIYFQIQEVKNYEQMVGFFCRDIYILQKKVYDIS